MVETENAGFNGWKLLSLSLIAVLLCGCFVGFFVFNGVSASPNFIEVAIDGPKKLGVNETGVYEANVLVEGTYEFNWSISPVDDKVSLVAKGAKCSLTFLSATMEPYLLSVHVQNNDVGNMGYTSMVVYDPYTSSSYYLSAPVSSIAFSIQADGLGWYRAVSGADGSAYYASTDAGYTVNSAILNAGGGEVRLVDAIVIATSIDMNVSSTHLSGMGYSSAITGAVGFTDNFVEISATNCELNGVNIDGGAGTIGAYGIYLTSTGVKIHEVTVQRTASDALHIGHNTWIGVLGGKIYDSVFKNGDGNGIYVDYDATDFEISNCLVSTFDATDKGGLVVDGGSLMVSLCHFWGNYHNIIVAPAHNLYRLRLVNNGIMDCDHHGIYWDSTKNFRDFVITGNEFWANGYLTPYNVSDSIYLGGSGSVLAGSIVGNTVYGYKEDVSQQCTRYFINDVNDKMTYCTIVANTIDRCGMADPIFLDAAGNNCEEAHNTLYMCG